MSLFKNLFKKPEVHKQQEQSLEEYVAELRAKRMAERQPVLSRGSVKNAPDGFNHFNLNDVVIGREENAIRYLFAGDNAAVLVRDLQILNNLARAANDLVPDLPDFSIDRTEISFDPFPDEVRQRWLFSRLIIEGLTGTGKLKKYPVSAHIETITGEKFATLYYTLDGTIGKGGVSVHLHPHSKQYISYSFDFINGVVSHIWKNTQADKIELYNKNHDKL